MVKNKEVYANLTSGLSYKIKNQANTGKSIKDSKSIKNNTNKK